MRQQASGQMRLFDLRGPFERNEVPPHAPNRPTSEAAARATMPSRAEQCRRVLALFRAAGPRGLIDDEIASALNIPPTSAPPRRKELVEEGLVAMTSMRRLTRHGNPAIVWVATGTGCPRGSNN